MLNLPFQFLTQIFPPFSLQFCTCLFLESLSGHSDVCFWLGTSAVEVGGSGEALVSHDAVEQVELPYSPDPFSSISL